MNVPIERMPPLQAQEVQGFLKDTIEGIKQDPFVDYPDQVDLLPTTSIKAFIDAMEAHEYMGGDKHSGVVKALDHLAKKGNFKMFFEVLNELRKDRADIIKEVLSDKVVNTLLEAVAEKGNDKEYFFVLNQLRPFFPDVGDFIFHSDTGTPKGASVTLVTMYLKEANILSENTPSDLFKKLFFPLRSETQKEEILTMLRTASAKGDHVLYCFLLKELNKVFPEIGKIVTSNGILTPDGVRTIIKQLQAKEIIAPDMPCRVFDTLPEFFEAIKNAKADPHFTRGCFIVRHCDTPDTGSDHMTPVLVEKIGDSLRVLTTDSTGSGKFTTAVQMGLCRAIPDIKLAAFTVRRQFDETNCPIFSILDVAYLSHHPEIMKAFDQENVQIKAIYDEKDNDTPYTFINFNYRRIPGQVMRITQSTEELNRYLQQVDEEPIVQTKKESLPLRGAVKKHTATVVTRKGPSNRNMLALKKFYRFSKRLTAEALKPAIGVAA